MQCPITREETVRRIDLAVPSASLLIEKSIGAVAHTGGKRFEADSQYNKTLLRWLEAGAPQDAGEPPVVSELQIFPRKAVIEGAGSTQQFLSRARYTDGTDRDVTDLAPRDRKIAMVFQSYAVFPHLTVFDNIAFGLKYRKVPGEERKQRVKESLALVHLPGMELRYPRQLSGGQQQRIALARALVVNTAVLFLDEPLSNLDLKLREKMRIELKQIQEQVGITFVFVTHDQQEALMLSDRIAVIDKGKLVQVGTPREVYERPQLRFVAQFVGQSNFLEGHIVNLCANATEVRLSSGLHLSIPATLHLATGRKVTVQVRSERVRIFAERPLDRGHEFTSACSW